MSEEDLLTKLYQMAAASPRKEICGVIASNREVFPIQNVAADGNQFVMHKAEYLRLMTRLEAWELTVFAIYHSHPNGCVDPSAADIAAAKRTGHNYLIITPNHKYKWVNT